MQNQSAITSGGLRFAAPIPPKSEAIKPKREMRQKVKNDPRLVAAARELRDRWLEHANAHPEALLPQGGRGKYDVSSTLRLDSTTRLSSPKSELIEVRPEGSRAGGVVQHAPAKEVPLLVDHAAAA